MRLIIDGIDFTAFVAFSGIKWSRNDIDGPNAGRNLAGSMIRDRVATKVRLDITCVPMDKNAHYVLMDALSPEFVTVEYDDPLMGPVSKVMYANNHNSTYYMERENGQEIWYNVSFPLIEK